MSDSNETIQNDAELKLLRDVFSKAKDMIFTECNGGKEHQKARIAFKFAVKNMMQFDEGFLSDDELTKMLSSV